MRRITCQEAPGKRNGPDSNTGLFAFSVLAARPATSSGYSYSKIQLAHFPSPLHAGFDNGVR